MRLHEAGSGQAPALMPQGASGEAGAAPHHGHDRRSLFLWATALNWLQPTGESVVPEVRVPTLDDFRGANGRIHPTVARIALSDALSGAARPLSEVRPHVFTPAEAADLHATTSATHYLRPLPKASAAPGTHATVISDYPAGG
jgi:hypothetical protein